MPGNIVQKESERRVFGKVFVSGLKQVSLSSRTVGSFHETHHCSTGFILPLVCLFLPTAHPASLSFARVFFSLFSFSLSLSFYLLPFLSFSFPLALFLDLCRRHIFLSLSLSLYPCVYLPFPPRNLLPNGVPYGRSPSACLPERSMLRFGRRSWFSMAWLDAFLIIGRVLPSPEEILRVSSICPATANRSNRRGRKCRRSPLADFTLSRASRQAPIVRARVPDTRSRLGFAKSIVDCIIAPMPDEKRKSRANQFECNVRSVITAVNWHSKISSRIWIKHYSNLFEINWEIILSNIYIEISIIIQVFAISYYLKVFKII